MSSSFLPNQINGLRLWLDAADANTLTLSGSNVTQWNDKSASGLILAQSTSSNQPILGPLLNNLQTIEFTTGRSFASTTSLLTNPAQSWFVVFNAYNNVNSNRFWLSHNSNILLTGGEYFFGGNGTIWANRKSGNLSQERAIIDSVGLNVTPFNSGQWYIANVVDSNTTTNINSFSFRIDGSNRSISIFSTSSNILTGTANINVYINGNGPTANVYHSEIIFYNTALSISQVQRVEGYLAWKWGLVASLPASHPYKLFPPVSTNLPIVSSPPFTGVEYIRRPFSYTFSSTITDYPTQLQFIDSSPGLLSSVSGDTFASTTGFQGSTGSAGTLIVDAIALSNTAFSSLYAGYTPGFTNGTGINARFNIPSQFEFDAASNMYVADYSNDVIRKVTPQQDVTTYVTTGTQPTGLVIDRDSNLYVSLTANYRIDKITPSLVTTTLAGAGVYGFADGTGTAARFSFLGGLAIDSNTNDIYIADSFNYAIRKVTSNGVVTTIAGNGTSGNADGVGSNARFSEMKSVLLASDGYLYVPDAYNNKIRRINLSTREVTTYAGTGAVGSNDGSLTTATFNFPTDITQDSESNFYVTDTFNYKIRKISGNTVSTYAGNGSPVYADGLSTGFTPRYIKYLNNNVYITEHNSSQPISSTIRTITAYQRGQESIRPGGNVPTGYVIVGSISTPITVLSRLDISTTAINNVFQLYKYEPFSGNTFTRVLPGDTLSFARSSGQIITSLTSNSNVITFASSNGYQSSFSNLQLIVDVISNGIIVDSNSNTVNVGVGRFFPPISNTAYTFYKNETITPVRFSTVLPVSTPISSPSLPAGLSFVQVSSNIYDLTGTPLLETPNSNYLIIGNGTGSNAGKTVTTTISIVVNGERINLDVSGTLNYTGLTQDVSLNPNTTITARYPAGGAIRYTWSPPLLPGFTFTDSTGSQQTGNSIFPTDLSGSITLSGAPTASAIQILSASQLNSYSVNLTATRITPSPNITATKTFTFQFSPAVYFDQVSTPTLFAGIPVPSNSVYFGARTVLSLTDTSISDIFLTSGSLPDGLALTFSNLEARAYINGTPSSTVSPQFTLRASNTLGNTQDYTTTLTIINDTVSFTNPLVDACYNFIQFRPISNVTTGWYTYPIQFTASAASLCNITMTTSDLNGTGLSLVPVGTNTYQISGTPTTSKALTTINVTATAAISGATATNNKVKYSISGDVITLDPETITCIQNRPITPIQFSGTTLSGRPIVSFTSSNLPAGFALSSTGLLSGTHTGSVSGSFTVAASTGYSSVSSNYSFTVTPDRIITIPLGGLTSYPLVPGDPYPSVQFKGISYSGATPSNYTYVSLTGSIPNLGVNSISGILTGTVPGSLVGVSGTSSIQSSVGSVSGTGNLITVSLNSNTIQFSIVVDPTITFSSPIASEYIVNQYVPIIPIQFSISSPGTPYFFADTSSLPRGITFDPVSAQLQGTPSQVGEYIITVYVYVDGVGYSFTSITLSVIIPRILRQQTSASAYTSMVRQYTLVNAAQNARGNRVLTEDGKQGEFMAPMGTDNLIPNNCFICDPNSTSNASNA